MILTYHLSPKFPSTSSIHPYSRLNEEVDESYRNKRASFTSWLVMETQFVNRPNLNVNLSANLFKFSTKGNTKLEAESDKNTKYCQLGLSLYPTIPFFKVYHEMLEDPDKFLPLLNEILLGTKFSKTWSIESIVTRNSENYQIKLKSAENATPLRGLYNVYDAANGGSNYIDILFNEHFIEKYIADKDLISELVLAVPSMPTLVSKLIGHGLMTEHGSQTYSNNNLIEASTIRNKLIEYTSISNVKTRSPNFHFHIKTGGNYCSGNFTSSRKQNGNELPFFDRILSSFQVYNFNSFLSSDSDEKKFNLKTIFTEEFINRLSVVLKGTAEHRLINQLLKPDNIIRKDAKLAFKKIVSLLEAYQALTGDTSLTVIKVHKPRSKGD